MLVYNVKNVCWFNLYSIHDRVYKIHTRNLFRFLNNKISTHKLYPGTIWHKVSKKKFPEKIRKKSTSLGTKLLTYFNKFYEVFKAS